MAPSISSKSLYTLPSSTSNSALSRSRRLSRTKERRRISSMELPPQLKPDNSSEEEEDEGNEDALSPDLLLSRHPEAFVQQSMYGIIAAAHSKGSIAGGLGLGVGGDSGGSGSDTEVDSGRDGKGQQNGRAGASAGSRTDDAKRPNSKAKHSKKKTGEDSTSRPPSSKHTREKTSSQYQDLMTHSQLLPSPRAIVEESDRKHLHSAGRDAPMLDRKIQARARADMDASTTSTTSTRTTKEPRAKAPVVLAEALAEIFQFDEPEEVVSEYACWYLQSVLLQGYLYITQKHVCFYAYLQKKGNVIKSGHLGKQGKHNPRYRRYWFTLRGDVLAYFGSANEPYFPSGSIDLRYGIAAELAAEKGHDVNMTTTFTITTDKRTYHFRADSASSAKEWVRQLQKVIFRSHNEGDSVKISLPLENIVDVEQVSIVDRADTVKLRVIDSEETYAVDEYFFTFFSHGEKARKDLEVMTQGNEVRKSATAMESAPAHEAAPSAQKLWPPPFRRSLSIDRSPRLSSSTAGPSPSLPEPVRSTLSPMSAGGPSSPRLSGEQTRRSSGDAGRPSLDRGRSSFERGRTSASSPAGSRSRSRFRLSKSPLSPPPEPPPQEESETYFSARQRSTDEARDVNEAEAEADMSASQILTAPTIRMPLPRRTVSGTTVERLRSESREMSPQPTSTTSESGRASLAPTRTQTTLGATSSSSPTTSLARTPTEEYFEPSKSSSKKSQGAGEAYYSSNAAARPLRSTITAPFQQAIGVLGAVRDQGKRMSSYLSSSPKNYIEKFSGAIAGGKRHYSDPDGLTSDDRTRDAEDDVDAEEDQRRFQEHFGLREGEKLRAVYYCYLHRVLPLYGKIYISSHFFCFRSLIYGTRTRLVVPFRDIDNAEKEKGFRWGYPGMVLVIRGHEELFFDFGGMGVRDDCVVTVLRALDGLRSLSLTTGEGGEVDLQSVVWSEREKLEAEEAAAENELLLDARKKDVLDDDGGGEHGLPLQDRPENKDLFDDTPVLFDDPNASVLDFRPKTSMRITCLTIGSRGDVQPYIALAKGFQAQGHFVKIATHSTFEHWIRGHGIEFAPVEGDPAELMRLCVELGMFTPSFMLETSSFARGWLDKLLHSSWKACQGSDLLIESPSAMAGIHIAEALRIPYFRAFTMPWTKTRAYPHAFATPNQKMGGKYNYMTYVIFEHVFWQLTAGQINRWRRRELGLGVTDLGKMAPNKVPFLYNFSPSVVVPPLDFSDWIRVTGYWFLDEAEGEEWRPPVELETFIRKARSEGKKLVYVGFGSIPMSDLSAVTRTIVEAVVKADVRCIFSKGWADHFDNNDKMKDDPNAPSTLPDSIFQIRAAPHDYLFPRIDCAVHHGGAGTTGASLRAGIPTIIKPFFGDQFFFASRVEDLGVGIHVKKFTSQGLGRAIWLGAHDERMARKAQRLGERIRAERGVEVAVQAVWRDLEYARSLIKGKTGSNVEAAGQGGKVDEGDEEESWTFVDGSDVDVTGSRRTSGTHGLYDQEGRRSSLGSRVLGVSNR